MTAANRNTLSASIDALERIREDLLRLQTDLETLEGLRFGAAEEQENVKPDSAHRQRRKKNR